MKIKKYFIILGLFIAGIVKSQNVEPSTVIENFVISSIRDDSTAAKTCVITDSLYKTFYVDNGIKTSDNIQPSSILYMYRLYFLGGFDFILIYKDQIEPQNMLLNYSEFKIIKQLPNFLMADYTFKLLGNDKVRFTCRMAYVNKEWKITSIKKKLQKSTTKNGK